MPTTNCLITGGTAGIGKAAALELARRGASVIIVGRDAGRGEAAVAELRDSSGNDSLDESLSLEMPPPSGAPEPPPNVVFRLFRWVTDRVKWRLFPSGLSTPEEAAQRLVYLALSQGVEGQSGLYFVNNEPVPPAPIARDPRVTADLWRESASLVGL